MNGRSVECYSKDMAGEYGRYVECYSKVKAGECGEW